MHPASKQARGSHSVGASCVTEGRGGAGRTKKWTRDCWKVNSDLAMRSALQAAFRTTEHNFFQYANRQLGPSIFLLVVLFAIFRLQA